MNNSNVLMMTPGPTYVSEEVRRAMSQPIVQSDIDPVFYELYKETTEIIGEILHTKEEVLILDGEGILGLEAACASLIEEGDKILVLNNGIFGEGFGDFAAMYGGECSYFNSDWRRPIDIVALSSFLENNNDFKLATIVHCETPSGLVNPIDLICPLLSQYGILTVVDAVSSIGGVPILTDEWSIDILLGGSQKCFSAPPGLTFLSVSQAAKDAMRSRKTPIRAFYANLMIWEGWYEKQWFPYTQPVSDIFALNTAAKKVLDDEEFCVRHSRLAEKVRREILALGFELYPKDGYSDTVTAVCVPDGLNDVEFRRRLLEEQQVMITGAFGPLEGKVFRIGHMGENCYEDKVQKTIEAIRAVYTTMKR